ncbi:MAG: Fis family transcriptional regulator [Bacteroidetes bacterium QS_9_68_14]|nr:MAG: Fis family transcriptional regulator [Bacteroidetes bacterium QS_9_68_14]
MPTVLVVDDEAAIRRTLREILEYEDYEVVGAEDGQEALDELRSAPYDLALVDVKMPDPDGMEVLRTASDEMPELPVVMISGHGTIETAVEATKLGAFDFIEKPPDLNHLLVTVRNALDRGELEVQNRRMRQTLTEKQNSDLTPIIGESEPIEEITSTIHRVAPTEARVLVTGEHGTGKELVAKWVHHLSEREEGPMVEVNCAAIPPDLIESELFGHEKGSFTGATEQRTGKFEQAHEGTLFLDEVGDMSLAAQAKVLRVLQEDKIQRVGGDKAIPVDVRVVAATNKDLLEEIEAGNFREDLYHRLSVILIDVPPLRERRGDVPLITEHFAAQSVRRNGLPEKHFSEEALERMKAYEWRGNVRELHNVVERLLIMSESDEITAADVDRYVRPGVASASANGEAPPSEEAAAPEADATGEDDAAGKKDAENGGADRPGEAVADLLAEHDEFSAFRDRAEEIFIRRKLHEFEWNVSRTAEAIGIQRSHLYNKLNKFGIERGD